VHNMLKFNALTTPIRIQKNQNQVNENGFPVEEWIDIIPDAIFCEWKNKFGAETYKNLAQQVKQPASIRLWYMPDIDETCRVIRIDDGVIFEIVSVDNVGNRNQQLEIEVKSFIEG